MLHILLISDPKHHHAPSGAEMLAAILRSAEMTVTETEDVSAVESLADASYNCVMLYTQGDTFNPHQVESLTKWVRGDDIRGGALVGVHSATATNKADDRYARLIGSRFIGHGPVGDFTVRISNPNHPIVDGLSDFAITDELYRLQPFDAFETFLTADLDGQAQPMGYSKREGNGRVVYLANGHDTRSIGHPTFGELLARAVKFAAGGKEAAI